MKGMIEVYFPSLKDGRALGAIKKRKQDQGRWLNRSTQLSAFNLVPSISKGITVGDYIELLRREHLLKRLSTQWASFRPSRISLRLHEDWVEHVGHAQSVARNINLSLEPVDGDESSQVEPAVEIVIPANRVSRIHKHSSILQAPLVTISDLYSETPCKDWSLCEAYATLATKHKLLGLEFNYSSSKNEKESLRRQLKIASLLKPKFIRLMQTPEVSDSVFCHASEHDKDQMNKLSLGLEAFSTLGFEPVAVYPRAIVLSSQPELDWKQLGIPGKVLGLGVGASSRRLDAASREISSTNSTVYAQYRKAVQRRWSKRSAIQKAQTVPYLHKAIENDLSKGDGLCYESIRNQFGFDLEQVHPGLSTVLKDAGLVEQSADRLVLTPKARQDPNLVVRNFFLGEQDLGRV